MKSNENHPFTRHKARKFSHFLAVGYGHQWVDSLDSKAQVSINPLFRLPAEGKTQTGLIAPYPTVTPF